MNHRDFFEEAAENWDKSGKPEHTKLRKIIEIADIQKGENILDVGSGTGILLPLLREAVGEKGKVTALDISFNMLKRASEKNSEKNKHLFSYLQADAGNIPLAESVFDKVICFSVFPHFSDKEKALPEIFRTLKNKGKLLIAHSESREKINAIHKKIGGVVENDCIPEEEKMIELLEKAGFTSVTVTDNDDFYLASGTKKIESSTLDR